MRLCTLISSSCMAALLSGCTTISGEAAPATAGASAVAPSLTAATDVLGWPHDASDLAPDPAIRYGRLANGLRFALRRNSTPPGEGQLFLRIGAGSLAENDDQLGLAHFMEHMIFNGTSNVPEGEAVKRLERLGLAFGADTNAFTSFDQTVYSLNLPSVSDEVVDAALFHLREGASEALLDPAAIDRERGVVLSEERMRDGPGHRLGRAQLEFLFKGQLIPKRHPIGTIDILKTAPRERFAEFYRSYYRPENAVVIAVGDFDLDAIEGKIRKQFEDWRNNGSAGPVPDIGPVAPRQQEVLTLAEQGLPATVAMNWTSDPDREPDTREKRIKEMREHIGLAVLNRRFSRLALRSDPPFTRASAAHGSALDAISSTSINAEFANGDWQRALEAVDQEHRRLVRYGVTMDEMDRAIDRLRASLKNQLEASATRASSTLADNILQGIALNKVVTTPEDRLASFEDAVRDLTPEQVSADLSRMFRGNGPLIVATSPTPLDGGEAAISRAYASSQRVAVAPPQASSSKPWPYTAFGNTGAVVEQRTVADLGTTFVRFANGVRLTVRPSTTEKSTVLVSVRAGHGRLDLPTDKASTVWAARAALIDGGLGKLTVEEIDDSLTPANYGANVSIDDDGFSLAGATRPEDLLTQMRVLAAFVTDPGWRAEGVERTKASGITAFEQSRTSPGGVLNRELPKILRSGDRRFESPDAEDIRKTSIAEVREALQPLLDEPLEVIVAGDLTVAAAIEVAIQTFGALPPRQDKGFAPVAARVTFPLQPSEPLKLTHEGRADQAMVLLAWPTSDFPSDPQMARTTKVLEAVLRLRLLDEIREKQGVTYSPRVVSEASWAFPDYGYVAALIEAPPARLEPFIADTLTIARSLRDTPISADELQRAVGPQIAAQQRSLEYSNYWLSALAGAQEDPRRLEAIRNSVSGLKRVTPEDVQRAAQKYLLDNRSFRLLVVPAAGEPAT